jgi:hypothetical protein
MRLAPNARLHVSAKRQSEKGVRYEETTALTSLSVDRDGRGRPLSTHPRRRKHTILRPLSGWFQRGGMSAMGAELSFIVP